MSQTTWDRKYLDLAQFYSTWSKDPSTKVGAVLVNWDHGMEFGGYNGFPRGVEDTQERLNNREIKYKLVVHAEANAILKAKQYTRGSSLYVYCPGFGNPCICNECAKLAIQAGVREVVGVSADKTELAERWKDSIKFVAGMLDEAGVKYREVL